MSDPFVIPVLETVRLRLRAPRTDDWPAWAAFRADPERTRWIGGPKIEDLAWYEFCSIAGEWAALGFGRFLVADRADDAPLGVVGPTRPPTSPETELAWAVFEGAEGRGIAHEAAVAARTWAAGHGIARPISLILPGAARSLALARRLGCVREADLVHPAIGALQVWRHPEPAA